MPRGTTRRRFLTAAGVAGATALAGCGGGSGGGSGGSGSGGTIVWLYGDSDPVLAQELRRIVNANAQGIQVELRQGGSDVENLKQLNRGNADFVVTGSDLAYLARNGGGVVGVQSAQQRLRGVGSFYPRPLTMFKAPDVAAERVEELSNVTINTGQPSSTLTLNTEQVLSGAGIQFTAQRNEMVAGVEQVARGEMDAAAAIGDWPVQAIQEISRNSEVGLLGVGRQTRQQAVTRSQWLVETRLPAAVYEGINYTIDTVGVMTLLVTRETLSAGRVVRVAQAIYDNADQIEVRSEYISKDGAERGMSVRLHEGADNYFNF